MVVGAGNVPRMTPRGAAVGTVEEKHVSRGAGDGARRVDLDAIRIGTEGWRVSLRDADRSNPFGLLGFVAEVDGRFRVCALGSPGAEIERETLDEAIDALRPSPEEAELMLHGGWS